MTVQVDQNPCTLCGEVNPARFKIYFDDYCKVYRCLSCGFLSQFPGPGIPRVTINYEDRYHLKFLEQGQKFKYPRKASLFKSTISIIKRHSFEGARLFDAGAGDGQFIYYCEQNGFNCSGVEGSTIQANYANSICKGKILSGLFDDKTCVPNSFDVISMNQVLEHIYNPRNIFKYAQNALKPDELFCIEVPSAHSPQFLLYNITKLKWFVKPPNGIIKPHINYFTPATLARLFESEGFRIVETITGRWSYKYKNLPKFIGIILDTLLNKFRIGGILIIGQKVS